MRVVDMSMSDLVVAQALAGTGDPASRIMQAVRIEGERTRVTLHLDLCADDPASARDLAVRLATAFGAVYPGIEPYAAQLSTADGWTDAQPLFCMADGPMGAFCAYPAGHEGWHAEAGVDAQRWGQGDRSGTTG